MKLLKLVSAVALQCLLWRAQAAPEASSVDLDATVEAEWIENELEPRTLPCPKGMHIVGVRGNSNRPPYPYGAMERSINTLLRRFPRSNAISIKYPKQQPDTTSRGTQLLLAHLRSYVKSCPNTPIVIAGYSIGGIITMDAICGLQGNNPPLNKAYLKHVIAVLTYGEESRVKGQPYNVGTCKNYNGALERSNAPACLPFKNVIQSYCDHGDPDCCVGSYPVKEYLHDTYARRYSGDSAVFVKKQLLKYLNGHKA